MSKFFKTIGHETYFFLHIVEYITASYRDI